MKESWVRIYAIGYYDGRGAGEGMREDPQPYGSKWSDTEWHWYKRGYEAGVADYSMFDIEGAEQ